MLDSLLPGDLTILSIGAALLILFLVFGTHKVYESILGSLLGILLFLLIGVLEQYTGPTATQTLPERMIIGSGDFLRRGSLILLLILTLYGPFSRMLFVRSMGSNKVWHVSKAIIYAVLYLLYFLSVLHIVIYGPQPFGVDNFFTPIQDLGWWRNYVANSFVFGFVQIHAYSIIFLGIVVMIAKVLFGHLFGRILMWVTIVLLTLKNIIVTLVTRRRGSHVMHEEVTTHQHIEEHPEDLE